MKRFVNFRPVVILVAVFAAGISAFYLGIKFHKIPAILLIIMPVMIGIVYRAVKGKSGRGKFIFCLACFIVVMLGYFNIQIRYDNFYVDNVGTEECVVTARLKSSKYTGRYYRLYFDDGEFTYGGKDYRGEEFSMTSSRVNLKVGDVIYFTANVTPTGRFADGEIDFTQFVYGNRFNVSGSLRDFVIKYNKLSMFEKVRLKFTDTINKNMDSSCASLLIAMMFGDDTQMDDLILDGSRYAGIGHLFAVSGLHVGIVAGFLYFILKIISTPRALRCMFSILATFFYCGMCDFSPSSLRAFIMFSFHIVFLSYGLKNDVMNSTATSAGLLLIFRPQFLFSYSFLLSFAAAFSIAVLIIPFKQVFGFLSSGLAESLAVLFSVQLGILPLSVFMFGYASPLSLPLNFLLIPLISPFFIFIVICVTLSLVTGLGRVLMFLPNLLAELLIRFVVDIDFGAATIDGRSTAVIVLIYYAGMLFASDLFNLNYKVKIGIFTLTTCTFILFSQLFLAGIL